MTTRDLRSRLRAQGFADDYVEVIATTVDEWLADNTVADNTVANIDEWQQ